MAERPLCPLSHRHHPPGDGEPCTRCGATDTAERDCPRPVGPGGALCRGHVTGLAQHLHELPGALDLLMLPRRSGAPLARIARHEHSEVGPPDATVDLRDHAYWVLALWVTLTVEEGRLVRRPQSTVAAMCAWLAGRLDVITGREWVKDLAEEVAELHRRAKGLAAVSEVQRIPIGPCPQPTECDVATRTERPDRACAGQVTAVLGLRAPLTAECGSCGMVVPLERLTRLGGQMGAGAALSSEEVALVTAFEGRPVNRATLRSWVHRGFLSPVWTGRGLRYRLADVLRVRDTPGRRDDDAE